MEDVAGSEDVPERGLSAACLRAGPRPRARVESIVVKDEEDECGAVVVDPSPCGRCRSSAGLGLNARSVASRAVTAHVIHRWANHWSPVSKFVNVSK